MVRTVVVEKKMISVGEAAKILGVSIDTIRRWNKSGKLHSERLNGKDRYFSLEELERVRFANPLSISEAAKQLKISPTTLRRLEKKGFISPRRTQGGERIYDGDVIKNFLDSDHFTKEKKVKGRISESSEEHTLNKEKETPIGSIATEKEAQSVEEKSQPVAPSEKTYVVRNRKPHQRMPEILAAMAVFLLLFTFALRNVMLSAAASFNSPPLAVLSTSNEIIPTISVTDTPVPSVDKTSLADILNISTPSAVLSATDEAKPVTMLKIKVDLDKVDIRQKPATSSAEIGLAKGGDIFELISISSDWYEVKLATASGFIQAAYMELTGGNK